MLGSTEEEKEEASKLTSYLILELEAIVQERGIGKSRKNVITHTQYGQISHLNTTHLHVHEGYLLLPLLYSPLSLEVQNPFLHFVMEYSWYF